MNIFIKTLTPSYDFKAAATTEMTISDSLYSRIISLDFIESATALTTVEKTIARKLKKEISLLQFDRTFAEFTVI